jgi:hypothetical protein
MSYQLYDEDGYIGDFATNKGAYDYLTYLKGLDNPDIERIVNHGVDVVPEAIVETLENIQVPDGPMEETHKNFIFMLKKCSGIAVISDGLNDDLEDLPEE